jgi:DNA polymerase (family 10)
VCAKAASEEEVYAALGVPFAQPELREHAGATPAATFPGVWGIFHVHTDWSDGASTIVEMAREAARTGFEYIGISDHSRAASYANGLDGARLREQASAIARARREVSGITILHGVEVDILADGALDLDDDVLGALDFVIASVHTDLVMEPAEMTARVIRAVSHPLVTMLGHPTGRLLLGRRGFTFDVEAVAKAAAANDTYLEINANAQRLDLSDVHVRRAAACGARFVINPDAHVMHGLADTALGVTLARRAGLSRDQVLNAREKDDLLKTLAARKSAALKRRRASSSRPGPS